MPQIRFGGELKALAIKGKIKNVNTIVMTIVDTLVKEERRMHSAAN